MHVPLIKLTATPHRLTDILKIWEVWIKMAKFSVGREEDDSEGPSSPRPKKLRTTCYQSQRQQENLTLDQQQEEEQEDEEVESEFDEQEDDEEEEGESEHAEEQEEEEEEGNAEESGRAHTGLRPIGDRASAGPNGDGSICVTLTDPDVLDCPICLEPLNSPVFQVCFSFERFSFVFFLWVRKGKEEESYDSNQDKLEDVKMVRES